MKGYEIAVVFGLVALSSAVVAQESQDEDPRVLLTAPDLGWNERRAAAVDLGRRGSDSIEPLVAALSHPDRDVRYAARVGLVGVGAPAVEALGALLIGDDESVKIGACEALGDFGAKALGVVDRLGLFLWSPNDALARAAREALIQVGRRLDLSYDEVDRTGGVMVEGLIVDEDDDLVEILNLRRSRSGVTVMKVAVPREEIETIRRAADSARPILRARIEAYRAGRKGRSGMAGGLSVRRERDWMEQEWDPAFQVTETEHFEIWALTSENFLREAAVRTEAMARAYEEAFDLPLEPAARVGVVIAGSRKEYVQMQERLFGSSILNPAFYYPPLDQIFAFSELEKWETLVEEVRKAHDGLRDAIDRIEAELRKTQIELNSGRREARDEIRRSALDQKRTNRSLSSQQRRAANRAVDEWYRTSLEALDAEEDRLREQIREFEAGLEDLDRETRQKDRELRRVFAQATDDMFETLAHEAFHAFFTNRIVLPEDVAEGMTRVRWLNEGMAMYFEAARHDGVDLYPGEPQPEWIEFLQERQKDGELFDLSRLLVGAHTDFLVHSEEQTDRSNTFYYQSWYLVRFLRERGVLRDPMAIRHYVSFLSDEVEAVEAFEALTGMKADRVWRQLQQELRVDDGRRYRWYRFEVEGRDDVPARARARIVMTTDDGVHVRFRDGTEHVFAPEAVVPD